VVGLGEPMLYVIALAGPVDGMTAISGSRLGAVLRQVGELDADIGEHDFDFIGNRLDQGVQEGDRGSGVSLIHQTGEGELRDLIDCNEEIELALAGPDLCNVDVEEANGVGLKALFDGLSPSTSGRRLVPCRWRQR
jgi:hypothetical protein